MEPEAGSTHDGTMANRSSASSACAVCQGIGEEGHPRGRVISHWYIRQMPYGHAYFHYPNLVVLRESAQNGCKVCAFLQRATRNGVPITEPYTWHPPYNRIWDEAEDLERRRKDIFDLGRDTEEVARLLEDLKDKDDYDSFRDALPKGSGRIILFIGGRSLVGIREEIGERSLDIHVLASSSGSLYNCQVSLLNARGEPLDSYSLYGPAQNLLSASYVNLVHSWMAICAAEHEKCRIQYGMHLGLSTELPTRVLDISSNPATGEIINIRLVETHGSRGTYASLSYCWGPVAQKSMTTTSNLAQHLDSIPLHSLPETISDTIKLCCKLGFRYVWVDSLCIVQDDRNDWLREAARMAGVYSHSALTLAIHLVDKSSESFLQKLLLQQEPPAYSRDVSPGWPPEWPPEPESLTDFATRLAYTDKTTGDDRTMHLWMDFKDKAVRFFAGGWANNGPLEHAKSRTSWLNRAWVLQEWLLSPRVLHISNMTLWDCFEGYGNELECRQMVSNPLFRAPSLLGTNILWADIVQEFTRREITKDTDRLPALAGLAEQYRKATGRQYLAGLWLEDLPATLLWHPRDRLESPTSYRAPSWSWASLEGPVEFRYMPPSKVDKATATVISAHCEYDPPGTLSTVTSGWLDIEGPMTVVTGRRDDGPNSLFLFINDEAVDHRKWFVEQDQRTTCTEEDVAQSKIHLLKVLDQLALLLQEVEEQNGGKDTFRRLGYAFRYNVEGPESWENRIMRLI